jgi:hypothetical protein
MIRTGMDESPLTTTMADWWRTRGARLALLFLAGVELAVMVAWLPDTLRQWWNAGPLAPSDERPMGDWQVFYAYAKALDANGLYNPILPVMQHPFTWLPIEAGYRLYVGIGALCVLTTAFLAQRSVTSLEARLAVVLGVVSLPQLHWALRGATLTPFLALATLSGFLLLEKRPRAAGLCFALLALKPQFALIPFAYLLLSRRWIALSWAAVATVLMTLAGLAVVGFGYTETYFGMLFDWGPDQRDNLSPIAQSWQHAWPGVLGSIGAQPHPLLWIDLIAVSLIALWFACRRMPPSMHGGPVALGMLLATPYAMFYDWGLLVVAGALLLTARSRYPVLVPALLVAGYVAAVATQAATPYPPRFPLVVDGVIAQPTATYGLYWTAPLALLALVVLAMRGQSTRDAQASV